MKAAANLALGEAAKQAFEAEVKRREDAEKFLNVPQKVQKSLAENPFLGSIGSAEVAKEAELNKTLELESINDIAEARKQASIQKTKEREQSFQDIASDLQKQAAELAKAFGFNFFDQKSEKDFSADILRIQADISKAEFEAIRIRRQREIDAQADIIADDKKGYEERLRAQKIFHDKSKELIALTKAFEIAQNAKTVNVEKTRIQIQLDDKTKKLTVEQRADLNKELSLLSLKQAAEEKVIREKAISEQAKIDRIYPKQRRDLLRQVTVAEEKLADEIRGIRTKTLQDTLELLQDEFDRRAKLIDFNERRELDDSKDAVKKRLQNLDIFQKLLLPEKEYQEARAVIISNGEQQALNIMQKYAQDRKDLAADTFEQILDAYRHAIDIADTIRDTGVAKQIKNVSDRFLAGKISYEKFQREITKIQRDNDAIRRAANLQTLRDELKQTEDQLLKLDAADEKQAKKLKARREKLLRDIADLDKENSLKNAEDQNLESRKNSAEEWAKAIGALAESVIQFWQKANEAEAAALDRSIQLQEKRVETAQRIAERGNASYLKEEEDKLKELNIKRENAARRQLAIDAALQASQLLVAITGAIAKIANPVPGAGIADVIASIAVIVGALASGYGLVKSLQGNQPQLAEGTTYLQRGKNPPGKDTIPAWLNEGEAIIPTERNKNYKKSVEAIYHGKVPADEMNRFVENYVTNKTVKNIKYQTDSINEYVYDTTNQNLSTYKNFVSNVSRVPAPVLNSFITNYQKAQYFKGTTELKRISEPIGKDTIPIMAHEGEAIIPTAINKLYQPTIKAVFDQNIPAEKINQFVREFHTIKPLPIPHYEKIKESAEMKISHDGRLAGLISEQNRMLAENNDLQRITIRALKSMGVNVNVDRNGLALSVMEVAEKIKIDSKT